MIETTLRVDRARLAPAMLSVLMIAGQTGCNDLFGLNKFQVVEGSGGDAGSGDAAGAGAGGKGDLCVNPMTDCEPPKSECMIATCEMGACVFKEAGPEAMLSQDAGDCKVRVCDGQGLVTTKDDPTDTKDDGNDCTVETCNADGSTSSTPEKAGAPCKGAPGKVCDGSGACVECLDDAMCSAPATCGGGGTAKVCGCSHLCTTSWAQRYGDFAAQGVSGLAVDSEGNVLLTGANSGTIQLGMKTLAQGSDDFYVVKLDKDGAPVWGLPFSGSGAEISSSIAVDPLDSVLLTGTFNATLDFLGEGGVMSAGGADIFVAKLGKGGSAAWHKAFGGADDEIARDIAADGSGDVLVTGSIKSPVDFGGGPLMVSGGGKDVFVARFDSNGNHKWSRAFGGTGDDEGVKVAADSAGNVIVLGNFGGEFLLDGTPVSGLGFADVFLVKLAANGALLWARAYYDIDGLDQIAHGLAIGADDSVILTGTFSGEIDLGGGHTFNGDGDTFVVKLDKDGGYQWATGLSGSGTQLAQSLALDSAGGVILSGFFQGELVADNALRLTSSGPDDLFLLKLDASTGAYLNGRAFGDNTSQWGTSLVAAGTGGSVYLASSFQGSADFGTGLLTNAGGTDIFLAAISP